MPTVTGIVPNSGSGNGGTFVEITGTNFTGATGVYFGAARATNFMVDPTGTKIGVTSPEATGTVNVTLTTPGGNSAISAEDLFTYGPVVTGLSPTSGPVTGGTSMRITGTGFTSATAVDFGTAAASTVSVVSDSEITAISPPGTGTVAVTVTTPGGLSPTSAADLFTYGPVVTGLSPTNGPAAGGTTVTITGKGFTGATQVCFGSTPATSFTVVSDTQITAVSSAGTGTVDVTVTTDRGTSGTSSEDQFNYAPTVTGISPISGSVAGGTLVTITGTGFTGATEVDFGSVKVKSGFAVDTSGNEIMITPPPMAVGTVNVTVTTANGTSVISSAGQFTYTGTTIGLYDPTSSLFMLRNTDTSGFADETFCYGVGGSGMLPIAGGWTGEGKQAVGLYDRATGVFYLSNNNTSQAADMTFVFGPANSQDIPIVGDWTGDGEQSVGLYDPTTSTFYLQNSNTTGTADITFVYGMANGGLIPLAGDWTDSGKDTVGLYNPTTSTFYLRDSNTTGIADITFVCGPANSGWTPLVGDWTDSGTDSVGLYSPTDSLFYLKNSNTTGFADTVVAYGAPNNGCKPIVGDWMSSAPVLTVTPISLTLPATTAGTAGSPTSFTVSGSGLGGGDTVTLTAPACCEISQSATSAFHQTLTLSADSGNLASTTVYARLSAWAGSYGDHVSGSLTVNDGNDSSLTQLLSVSGTVNPPQAEMAVQQVVALPDTASLPQNQLASIVNEAITLWSQAGLNAAQVRKLQQAQFVVTNLPGSYLGETVGNVIYLDGNAAGNGWFVDPTPASNVEFFAQAGSSQLKAVGPQAVDHIDLLTVVEHELGHIVGLADNDALPDDIMDGVLGVGMRRIASHADAVLASV